MPCLGFIHYCFEAVFRVFNTKLKKNPQDSLLKRVPTRIWTQKGVVFHCALRSILKCSPGQWSLLPESLKSTPLASVASLGGCLNSRSRLPTETLTHLLQEPLTPLPCTWLQAPRAGIGRDSVTFLTLGGSLPLGVEALLNHPPPQVSGNRSLTCLFILCHLRRG